MENSRTLKRADGMEPGRARRNAPITSGEVDYSLARKATIRAFKAGRVSRFEICDAHPDLLRAARFCGEKTSIPCPICERAPVLLVRYAFSDSFPKKEGGRVWAHDDLGPLMQLADARLYTVEVCPECSWNHVRSQLTVGRGRPRQRRGRAST